MSCESCKFFTTPIGGSPCNKCVHSYVDMYKPMTNYDCIISMTLRQLADFICDIYASNEHPEIRVDGKWMLPEDVEEWLNKVEEEEEHGNNCNE